MGIFNSLFGSATPETQGSANKPEPFRSTVSNHISDTPDLPCPFGYKTSWIAVRSDDPLAVLSHLSDGQPIPANWESGLTFSGVDNYVFVSPPAGDYVFAVGVGDHEMVRPLLEKLASIFADVQYFSSHRVVDYFCWARYLNGTLMRAYCYVGESGEVLWNEGKMTAEERALGFERFPAYTEEDRPDVDFPDEENVTAIAGAWGINPNDLEQVNELSVGYLCKWTAEL